jgi:TetR/AcrR family transcriptional regulator, transcriptional repressor for nem operon
MPPRRTRPPRAPAAPNLRSLSKGRTRQAIIDAALACFSEEGLDAPSLDAICARAGCTRGAFYVHFRDRDALIVAAMEHRRSAVLAAFLQSRAENTSILEALDIFSSAVEQRQFPPRGAVRTAEFLTACRRSEAIRGAQLDLMNRTRRQLEQSVEADQERGHARDDIDARAVATLVMLLEAGLELAIDIGWQVDMRRCSRALARMIGPREAPRGTNRPGERSRRRYGATMRAPTPERSK